MSCVRGSLVLGGLSMLEYGPFYAIRPGMKEGVVVMLFQKCLQMGGIFLKVPVHGVMQLLGVLSDLLLWYNGFVGEVLESRGYRWDRLCRALGVYVATGHGLAEATWSVISRTGNPSPGQGAGIGVCGGKKMISVVSASRHESWKPAAPQSLLLRVG